MKTKRIVRIAEVTIETEEEAVLRVEQSEEIPSETIRTHGEPRHPSVNRAEGRDSRKSAADLQGQAGTR